MRLLSLKRDVEDLNRVREILGVLAKHGLHAVGKRDLRVTPEAVRVVLEELGPTFVKLGQVLSLRPDLIPPAYCEELSRLQNEVKPLPFAVIKGVVEAELGRPLDKLFRSFDPRPLAAASISQVHRAALPGGKGVVVKVQRPGAAAALRSDIEVMRHVARRLDKAHPRLQAPAIIEEFKRYTDRELDFANERRSLRRFHAFFEKSSVVIPAVDEERCTSKVLVMERVTGVPLRNTAALRRAKHDPRVLARLGVDAMVRQAFELGAFHADPHPGNVLACRRRGKSALAFLDFGIVGYLDPALRSEVLLLVTSLAEGDARGVANALIRIGGGAGASDGFRGAVADVLLRAQGEEQRVSTTLMRLLRVALAHGVAIPPNATLIGKAFLTMEGTARRLDPSFDVAAELQARLPSLAPPVPSIASAYGELRQLGFEARALPERANAALRKLESGVDVRLDAAEFRGFEAYLDLEWTKRSLVTLAGASFLAGALLSGLAPGASVLGAPLAYVAYAFFLVFLLLFLGLSMRIHLYLRRQGVQR